MMIKRIKLPTYPISLKPVIPWHSVSWTKYNMFSRYVLAYYLCTREFHVPWRLAFKKGNVYKLPEYYNTNIAFKKLNNKTEVLIALNRYGGKLIIQEEEQ